jgi:fumarylacetoacetase
VGPGNHLGVPLTVRQAEDQILGLCIVNDWSARDIQVWEGQPLGPFLAKSFATSISPWVITFDALEPFRCPAFPRPDGDPQPLPYLSDPSNDAAGGFDVRVEVTLRSETMRRAGSATVSLSRGTLRDMYWTFAQMLTHHTSNGCNLRPGDLLASGTVSGPDEGAEGCLLEMTRGGKRPIRLPGGEERSFLADGDEVVMRAWCERDGYARIGFGECRGRIV